ncbi:MAG: hypothetical protein ACKOET_05810 [Verrucomicrobiota bacterium]
MTQPGVDLRQLLRRRVIGRSRIARSFAPPGSEPAGDQALLPIPNGEEYALAQLRPGKSRMVDAGASMTSEEDNRIELVGEGELGAVARPLDRGGQ